MKIEIKSQGIEPETFRLDELKDPKLIGRLFKIVGSNNRERFIPYHDKYHKVEILIFGQTGLSAVVVPLSSKFVECLDETITLSF